MSRRRRPDKGSLTGNEDAYLDGLLDDAVEREVESLPDGYEVDEDWQATPRGVEINAVASAFDDVAWKMLIKHIPTALLSGRGQQLGYGIPDEVSEEAYDIAVDLWTGSSGGHYCYLGAIGNGVSIEDGWYRSAPDDLDLKVLWRKMSGEPEFRQAAHNLENELYSTVAMYVDEHSWLVEDDEDEDEESAEVQRGPDHDTVVYRYAGTNDTIAGASGKGLYVAELGLGSLRDESKEMGHCIGNPQHGHPRLLKDGFTKVFSIRTEAGKTKFTIEQFIEDGEHPQQGKVNAGTVTEVKGKANRLPGFEPDKMEMTKPDEVRLVVEFLMKHLGLTPSQIEATNDIRGGVKAMQAMGQDPFSPPPKKAERPKRDPRALEAAVRLVKADYQRVALLSLVASA